MKTKIFNIDERVLAGLGFAINLLVFPGLGTLITKRIWLGLTELIIEGVLLIGQKYLVSLWLVYHLIWILILIENFIYYIRLEIKYRKHNHNKQSISKSNE